MVDRKTVGAFGAGLAAGILLLFGVQGAFRDPARDEVTARYAQLAAARRYDDAVRLLDEADAGVRARAQAWFAEKRQEVAERMTRRDARLAAAVAAAAAFEHDRAIEELRRLAQDDEAVVSPWREKLQAAILDLVDRREAAAAACWADLEKQVDALVEQQLAFDEAAKLCAGFPKRFASTRTATLVAAKAREVGRARDGTSVDELRAFESLQDAKTFRERNPNDLRGQLAAFEAVAKHFPGQKAGVQARLTWIPKVQAALLDAARQP